ncbi:hypothetical protein QTP86_003800 [Hemibagrus guttatus]|nr:hypothetical protein QTP86_003800 [Hemibagrus guttatus]
MKVSCSKTEYMCVNEREGSETVRLQGEEVKKVQEFKYLESTVQSNGEWAKEFSSLEELSEHQEISRIVALLTQKALEWAQVMGARPNVPEIEGCSPVNFFGVFCFLPSSVVNRQQQQAAFFLLSDALMSLVTQVSEATHGVRVQKEELRQVEPGDYVYVKVFKRKHWSQPRREGPFKLPSHMTWGKPGQSLPKKRPSQYVGAAEVGQEAQGQSEHRCNLFTLQEKTREQYGAWHLQGSGASKFDEIIATGRPFARMDQDAKESIVCKAYVASTEIRVQDFEDPEGLPIEFLFFARTCCVLVRAQTIGG